MTRQTLRGVNLGGWLLLERWMTPSLFEGTNAVDEYTFMTTPGAAAKLEKHRRAFITEKDFRWMKKHDVNALRLPIGYWIVEPDGPYKEGVFHVDWAFRMAEKYGLQILLDLHGAPDSQNGRDHSGRTGRAGWFSGETARRRTIKVLQELHERYKNSSSYWGIELLNEPKTGWCNWVLRQFYRAAARTINGRGSIVFHDGFRPRILSGALDGDDRAVMDIHLYHTTSRLAQYVSASRFVALSDWWWGCLLRCVNQRQPIIVGEWSIVVKGEKLRRLNKVAAHKLMHEFGKKQLVTYEKYAVAWFYWSYKTEEQDFWNFRWLIETGMLDLSPNRDEK